MASIITGVISELMTLFRFFVYKMVVTILCVLYISRSFLTGQNKKVYFVLLKKLKKPVSILYQVK